MPPVATSLAGLLVVALTVIAIIRRTEVRLTLITSALVLGLLVGDPMRIVRSFLAGLTDEKFLLPIASCMGFAYVLRHTGCDKHLVVLLLAPLKYFRFLLAPGVVLVAMFVNVPIISQSGTAIAVGTVLNPVFVAARLPPIICAAALTLGASIGGELLNPGAPELRTITAATHATAAECIERNWPLLLIHVSVAVPLFWLLCQFQKTNSTADGAPPRSDEEAPIASDPQIPQKVNPLKAIAPLVPLVFLFLTALPGPLRVFTIDPEWLGKNLSPEIYDGRLVGLAMLIGVVVAALSSPSQAGATAIHFFEGAGYALAHVTSLIIAANCFGEGVRAVGLDKHVGSLIGAYPGLLFPLASLAPLAFAWICGSGIAATQSMYGYFVEPARMLGADPLLVGAVVSISAAAGRTMSPVSAVNLVCASLTGTNSLAIARRVALPLLAGLVAVVIGAYFWNAQGPR
jgi:DcuC family C4-dicarboxylate transporter